MHIVANAQSLGDDDIEVEVTDEDMNDVSLLAELEGLSDTNQVIHSFIHSLKLTLIGFRSG